MVESLMKGNASSNASPGVDIESLDAVPMGNATFVERNFTPAEIAYCRKAASPQASFTGKWSAKEAVFKSLKVEGRGAGAPLREIEIGNDGTGAPTVTLHGDAKAAADKAGVKATTVSISHSDAQVIAVAISSF
ncbi:beta subunit of fatty acid synthetase [Teratosphaeriaceae sp. CCFEE 6253]|nr:beta subunit of fatty acid synthetase [Teratosphaeriaceae sp. CCFEE 6253]